MNARNTFKLAILDGMADRGLSMGETAQLLKSAADQLSRIPQPITPDLIKQALTGIPAAIGNVAGSTIQSLGPIAMMAAAGIPLATGILGGRAIAKMRDDDTDVPAAQADEKIMMYRQLAADARRRARQKSLRISSEG